MVITTTVLKLGNDLALSLPIVFCESLGIRIGDDVEIFVKDDSCIVLEPVRNKFTLKARMREWYGVRYKSTEPDWGPTVGEEIW